MCSVQAFIAVVVLVYFSGNLPHFEQDYSQGVYIELNESTFHRNVHVPIRREGPD